MDMITFCRTLCQELGEAGLTIKTGIFFGSREAILVYTLGGDICDIIVGAMSQGKPDLAKRLFLRLFSGIPTLGAQTQHDLPPE